MKSKGKKDARGADDVDVLDGPLSVHDLPRVRVRRLLAQPLRVRHEVHDERAGEVWRLWRTRERLVDAVYLHRAVEQRLYCGQLAFVDSIRADNYG